MRYTIKKTDRVPAYLQLYRQVRDDITGEIYPFGTRLPSKRTIAEELGLSTVTVEHAYALLCDEGYAEARERSGYFVSFRTGDGFAPSPAPSSVRPAPAAGAAPDPGSGPAGAAPDPGSAKAAPDPGSAGSRAFPFSVLVKTMRRVINDFGESILERSPNSGCEELREAISRYLARSRGITAGTEQIVIGSGAEYLYSLVVQLLGREPVYGIESPSYQKIRQVYETSGARLELLPLGSDGIESSALWASRAGILHISPYRSFPSGVSASASKRHEYLRWASEKGRYIVEDDFESEFSILRKPEETLFSNTGDENVIYLNTFSQTISPALRAGYLVLPPSLVPVFERKLGFYSCTVPTYMQYVLAELISGGDFERHINRVRREKRRANFLSS